MRPSTSGPETLRFDAPTSRSSVARRNASSASASSCSRRRCSTEIVERVELGGGARELVVERRQHLFLDLLHRDLHGRALLAGALELDVLRLADRHADELLLELGKQAAGAQLDDVVPLAAVLRQQIDDDGVALLGGPALDRRQLRDR